MVKIIGGVSGTKKMSRIIYSKIVGTTFIDNGKNLDLLKVGDELSISKEPNPVHDKAILLRFAGKKIGFIKKELANDIYFKIQKVKVVDIREKNGYKGINIEVQIQDG